MITDADIVDAMNELMDKQEKAESQKEYDAFTEGLAALEKLRAKL